VKNRTNLYTLKIKGRDILLIASSFIILILSIYTSIYIHVPSITQMMQC